MSFELHNPRRDTGIETTHFTLQYLQLDPENTEAAHSYWEKRTLDQVKAEMPALERYGSAPIVVVEPEAGIELDETQTHILPMECGKGYTPDAYVRAKDYQERFVPNCRVVMLPGNSGQQQLINFDHFSPSEKAGFCAGDFRPMGKLLMGTLERAHKAHGFGELYIHGPSMGALSAFAIAAAGSSSLDIAAVSAIEPPSRFGRSKPGLAWDLATSMGDFKSAIKQSPISALNELFSKVYMRADGRSFLKFVARTEAGSLVVSGMTGSANDLIATALEQLPKDVDVTVQYFADSKVFDPNSLSPRVQSGVRILQHLSGPEIPQSQKHISFNNPVYNAAMACDAFSSGPRITRNVPVSFGR